MITIPNLKASLLDLLHEIEDKDIKLIIGGGFGIYLKIFYMQNRGERTLLQEWPEPRSTNDLDLFLHPELLIESAKLKPFAEAIARLGYKVIPGAEKYQFVKPGAGGTDAGSIKIDILTGPQSCFKDTKVKVDIRRARPTPSIGIHAHPVDEVPSLEEGLLLVKLEGKLSLGDTYQAEIFLPHPYTFSMMKLFAFKDRLDDPNKEFGRYHALDLYTIIATAGEDEWRYALELRDKQRNHPYTLEAGKLILKYFSARDKLGIIRLRESPYYRPEFQLDEFMSALQELFPLTKK